MTALTWDELEDRFFETGVDHGVLYKREAGVYADGQAWNGLTSVTAAPSGAEANAQYADNIKYLNLFSAEEFGATIECFTAPDGFLVFDGVKKTASGLRVGQQSRPTFGFSWRTKKGNAENEDLGYIIHFAYGCQTSPSEKAYNTVNDSPEPITFSWTLTTTPVNVPGFKPTAYISVDSTDPVVNPTNLAALETVLYGSVGVAPRLPLPAEIDAILGSGISLVTPQQPTFDGVDEITIPSQTGVVYKIDGVTQSSGSKTIAVDTIVTASPATGYTFDGVFVDRWLFEV